MNKSQNHRFREYLKMNIDWKIWFQKVGKYFLCFSIYNILKLNIRVFSNITYICCYQSAFLVNTNLGYNRLWIIIQWWVARSKIQQNDEMTNIYSLYIYHFLQTCFVTLHQVKAKTVIWRCMHGNFMSIIYENRPKPN